MRPGIWEVLATKLKAVRLDLGQIQGLFVDEAAAGCEEALLDVEFDKAFLACSFSGPAVCFV